MATIVWVGSIFLVFFAYFGYPLTLMAMRLARTRTVRKAETTPSVTLLITVHNEAARIVSKLENSRELDYPPEKLQVLVASDGSTDATNEIVRSWRDRHVDLLEIPERGGKESAQQKALGQARGEVVVFSDVATRIPPAGLRAMVANFADPAVGCVSSEDRLIGQDGQPGGEGLYVRYEMWLRRLESSVNSVVGLSGSFFAARREVCEDFSPEMQSDFRTLLNSIRLGMRGVSDPDAVGIYQDIADEKLEFNRKVRTVLRGLTVFLAHTEFLNVFRYGLFSYQYFCHKLLRWLVPFFLVSAFVANIILVPRSPVWALLFLGQCAFYGCGIYGWRVRPAGSRMRGIMKLCVYFLTVNASIFLAWVRYFRGQRVVIWTPSRR